MALEKILSKIKTDFLPPSRERIKDYVEKYELKNYFGDSVPQEYRDNFRKGLEKITDDVVNKYSSELRSLVRTPVGKGAMALAVANDISAYATTVPFDNVTALGYVLFAAKTIAEIPALARYVRKSKDWYGAIKHIALKPLRYLIPVIGPAIESGAFERMVKRRVRKEITRQFIKQYGDYKPIEEKLKNKLKEPLREHIYVPEKERERELVEVG